MLSLLLALLIPAHSADLSESILGIPWGPAPTIDALPGECQPDDDSTAIGRCTMEVGGVPVDVLWHATGGELAAVAISTTGGDCVALLAVVEGAWGRGRPTVPGARSVLDPRSWKAGPIIASWRTGAGRVCQVAAADMGALKRAKAAGLEAGASSGL